MFALINSNIFNTMRTGIKILLAVVAIIALAVFSLLGLYNRLVGASERIDGQWAQVETQYQRRLDLIPNLVESVKGAQAQEVRVFGENLAEARTRYGGAATISDKIAAANQLESTIGRLLVILENYPELRSTETMQSLMVELEGTENRIGVERRRYNEQVRDYNVTIKRFPARVFAGLLGFGERPYFEASQGAEQAPSVKF